MEARCQDQKRPVTNCNTGRPAAEVRLSTQCLPATCLCHRQRRACEACSDRGLRPSREGSASNSPTCTTGVSTWMGGSSGLPVPCASGWRPGLMSAPAAGPPPSTRTCSSTGTPPYAKPPVSSPWISHTLGTSPQAIREDHILDEALAPAGTSAAFAICSASPSAAPNATPAPPKPARGAARSRAVSGQGRLSA